MNLPNMQTFADAYKNYIDIWQKAGHYFGFDLRNIVKLEPILRFLYEDWWRVSFKGIEHLPKKGPALVVGNEHGLIPWSGFMLMYVLMADKENPRKLNIAVDMDWIEDERVYSELIKIGFVSLSAINLKQLFSENEIVLVFPEGTAGMCKPFAERYRLKDFDWTKLLPAIEASVPIFPLATLGCDEAAPTLLNETNLAKLLKLPAYPVSPFFPWLPFPISMMPMPVKWRMHLLKSTRYKSSADRDKLEETAKEQARLLEGEIQAELNRMLRMRTKSIL